ncbi:hypothetical protein QL285_094314 [Trifolium repens]|nr:hypothetical protein QL285_094314 [Trifolium repens]
MWVSSVQARYGESPARYGEIIGPDLNQLAVASRSSPWRVSSAQSPARHECSPATRCGEFMQSLPCFAKIIFFSTIHLQSSFQSEQQDNLYNINQNGDEFGVNSSHTTIP